MQKIIQMDAGKWGNLQIDFSDDPKPKQMACAHSHDTWEIFFWLGSRMTYFLNGKTMAVPHSAVVPVPPHILHRTIYDSDKLRWKLDIQFENTFFEIFPSDDVRTKIMETLKSGLITVSVKWANNLRQTVVDTFLTADASDPLDTAKAAFAVASILTGLVQSTDTEQKKEHAVGIRHTHVSAAMTIIDNEYAPPITLEMLSERLHLTKTYICHIFHDVLGMTVSDYIRMKRIQAARTLLLDTTASVAEVAEHVGFGNVNYFTKCFRAEEGISPSGYRAVVLGGKGYKHKH